MFQQSSLLNSYSNKGELLYRCRGCNNNLSANDPASQYQRQKIIQNTVRIQSSLFTMNLGALNVYERPDSEYRLVDIAIALLSRCAPLRSLPIRLVFL